MGEAKEGASAAYDIFINHRGPDTKKSVASLIYHRLNSYGLRVFIDKEELEAEDPLYNKIESAIKSSSVHIAIFSVRYAESSWCLNELLDMLQSGCNVIPIFYDVKPADLRHIENGRYADAFRNHQNNGTHDAELVERWKDALKKASNISGMEFNTEEDDLGVLVEEIVEKVRNEPKWELLHVAENPVGLHQAAEDFNNFLKEKRLSGTTVVGIMGLGGSGKSTLVKHLYNCYLQSRKFKRYCFLSELNEKDSTVLQQKLVRDLLGDDEYSISDTSKGKGELQTCLRGCGPVLIVLDGSDKEQQIENLLLVLKNNVLAKEEQIESFPLAKDALAEGSLILVTCHDKSLLAGHQVNLFYHVKLLQGKDANDLFCSYAFDPPKPPKHLEDLVEKFLEICCGFPLALKVLGRKLSMDQDRRYWEEQLKDLSRPKFPKNVVDKILKVSYDRLEEKKKEVFLDVAHFLVGEDTDLAVRVLEGFYGSGLKCLQELQSKCLLDLEEIEHCKRPFAKGPCIQWRTKGSSKIKMHDLVRKMARQIASEDSCPSPAKPLRLCQLDDKSILQQLQSRGYHVRGIRCEYMGEPERQEQDINKPPLPRWPWRSRNMDKPEMTGGEIHGLRLLVLDDFRGPLPSNRLSGDLIWLRIYNFNWGNIIASTLSLRNLRVLELDGVNFEALRRMEGDKFPSKLGELTVDYCGESAEIPKRNLLSSSFVDKNSMEASSSASRSVWAWFRFIELPNLVQMVLKNVKGFKSLPIDFKALRNLRHLDLSGWSDLEKMPDSLTGLLQLQYLTLKDCMSLSLSDLGGITKLEHVDFEGCSLLRKLPNNTTGQTGLRYLNLMHTRIEELPQDFGKLNKLEQLLITSSSLTSLPRSFGNLGQLRILTLSGCPRLGDISSSIKIKHFPFLESLQLWEVGVMTVPQGIEWSSVKVLHVKASLGSKFNFEMLLDSSPSEGSTADGTQSVGATDHNTVSRLMELRLVETGISKLRIPPEESLFPHFEIVDLSGSRSLREVQNLPCNLRRLCLKNCTALTTLPCLSNLACIRMLDISGCHELEALNLEGLRSIEEIEAEDCWKLQSIRGLAQLRTLSYLKISTFNEVTNSTIWSEILGFPSNVSTVILGGANVIYMKAEKMDSLKQFVKEFQGATIIDIPPIGNLHRVELRNLELYGSLILCFIAKRYFIEFKVSVGDNVYNICRPSFVTRASVHEENEETHWVYAFMWSQNSNLFKDLTLQGKSVLDCTVEGLSAPLKKSFTKAWIMMVRNRTDGVKICKQLLNSLCCIPKVSSPPGSGLVKDTVEGIQSGAQLGT